jgi:hypothetical protein
MQWSMKECTCIFVMMIQNRGACDDKIAGRKLKSALGQSLKMVKVRH